MNPLRRLMDRCKKGGRPVFKPGPFLPLALIRQRGLVFNDILRKAEAMGEAARLNFELGFDSTDIYPRAKTENIIAFVDAVRNNVIPC